MSGEKFTREQIQKTVTEIVAERPDYVYTALPDPTNTDGQCVYIDGTGAPSCLIGHALVSLGVDPDELHAFEGESADSLPYWEDADAGYWATLVQVEQDMLEPWGESVRVADERFHRNPLRVP